MLSLLGYPTTRKQAFRLYGLKKSKHGYGGTTHQLIGRVVANAAEMDCWQWKYYHQFSFHSVARSILDHFGCTGLPTLISFGVVHKNGIWRCRHTTVVLGATDYSIDLLDPLAKPPRNGNTTNVSLHAHKPIIVVGNSYAIHVKSEVGVLHWSIKKHCHQGGCRFVHKR